MSACILAPMYTKIQPSNFHAGVPPLNLLPCPTLSFVQPSFTFPRISLMHSTLAWHAPNDPNLYASWILARLQARLEESIFPVALRGEQITRAISPPTLVALGWLTNRMRQNLRQPSPDSMHHGQNSRDHASVSRVGSMDLGPAAGRYPINEQMWFASIGLAWPQLSA